MPDDQAEAVELPLSAEEVAARSFSTAFRGFDPVEVRAFLGRLADELSAAEEREAALRRSIADGVLPEPGTGADLEAARAETARLAEALEHAETRLAEVEDRARVRDADTAEETARAVAEAETRASRSISEARDQAARILGDAREEAEKLRSEADRVLAEAKESAAASGIGLRREAEREAALIRVKAREEADAVIEAAKEHGREMVGEAQAVRERMLKDLNRRRRQAEAQLQHLKDARDRVLEHLRLAGRAVEDITSKFAPVEEGWGPPAPSAAGLPASTAPPPRPAPSQLAPEIRRPEPEAAPAAPVTSTPPPAAPDPEPQPPQPAPVAEEPSHREERKSSALRILRRNKPAASRPEVVSYDDPMEGVRIIGPPPRITPPEPEREREPEAALRPQLPEPDAESGAELDPEPEFEQLEPELDVDVDVDVDAARPQLPRAASEALATEGESIEALFARLRQAREVEPVARRPEDAAPEPEADQPLIHRRDVAIEEIEATFARRLKRALQDEQNAVLDGLRTHRGAAGVDGLVGDGDAQRQRYRRLAAPFLAQAAAAGAGAGSAQVDDLMDAFADEISESIRERLTRAMATSHAEELDPAATAERVGAVYREFKGQRAERLGAHYVVAAHARGAYDATEDGELMRWVVDDGGPCPDCDDNALAGQTAKGDEYPTGQLHPPAHLGCRCLLAPASSPN